MTEALLLSFEQAAKLLGIGRSLLFAMQADGRFGPKIYKLGRRSLINRRELGEWTDAGMPSRAIWERQKGGSDEPRV